MIASLYSLKTREAGRQEVMNKKLVVAGLIVGAVLCAVVLCVVGAQILHGGSQSLATGAGSAPTETGWLTLLASLLGTFGFGWAASWVGRFAPLVKQVVDHLPARRSEPPANELEKSGGYPLAAVQDTAEIALYLTLCQMVTDPKGKAELVKAARTACDNWRDGQFPIVSVEVAP